MTGIGLFLGYLGYAICFWAWEGINGNSQDPFIDYLLPWRGSSTINKTATPASTRKATDKNPPNTTTKKNSSGGTTTTTGP